MAKLYFDVELKRWTKTDKEQKSVSWACTQLSKSEEWGNLTPKMLQNRYTEAKNTPEVDTFLSLEKMINDPSKIVDLMKHFRSYLNKSTSK